MSNELIKQHLSESERIVSFGCSLTYGEELEDSTSDGLKFSKLAYPGIISNSINADYYSYARPGYSNDSILRTVYNYLTSDYRKGDFVLIGWSGIDRIELFNNVKNDYMSLFPASLEKLECNSTIAHESNDTLWNRSVTDIINAYKILLQYESDENRQAATERTIFYTIAVLEKYNVPFVMVNAMKITVPTLSDKFYNQRSFMQYAYNWYKKEDLAFKKNGHPCELAHERFAKIILDWIEHE